MEVNFTDNLDAPMATCLFCKRPITLRTGGSFSHEGSLHESCVDRYHEFGSLEAEKKWYDLQFEATEKYHEWRRNK